MAEKPASERTEQATPERLRKAREEGNIPTSEEVPSALIIVATIVVLVFLSADLYRYFVAQMQQGLTMGLRGPMDVATYGGLFKGKAGEMLLVLAPVLVVVMLASAGASLLSGGWSVSTKPLKLDLGRINPFAGMKNLISLTSLVKLSISMVKFAVIGVVVWLYIRDRMEDLLSLSGSTPEGTLSTALRLTLGVAGRIAVAMLAIAGADLLYQRWHHKRELRMSLQEVKEERKQYELPPEVKGRMRSIQLASTRKRMMKTVPQADVVIVNPTHVAVALKYDPKRMAAPMVVGKGADFLCQTIKEIAAKHKIPIVEKPDLARALYATVEEGQPVPESLYVAVAEVLAMIFKLKKKRSRVTA